MNSPNLLHERASELAEAAPTFQTAAGQPGSHAGAAGSLEALEEALQVLSAAWSQLVTDASPGIVERRRSRASEAGSWPHVDGLSREEEVRLIGTPHDVGAAFARCARACRHGRSRLDRSRGAEVSWLEVPDRPAKSAA
jgi:hypothetical protein